MTWTEIYLVCLIVGFALSVLTLVSGALHFDFGRPGHVFTLFDHGSLFGDHATGGHGHSLGLHGHADGGAHASDGGHAHQLSAASFSTLMVFLAWFGGAGAVLSGAALVRPLFAFPVAVASGMFGAWLVVQFANRVLFARDHSMQKGEYSLPGTLATTTLAIREGGCGEIVYVQGGTRKSAAARSEQGSAIANGTEVFVTRFVDGVAYVRAWHVSESGEDSIS